MSAVTDSGGWSSRRRPGAGGQYVQDDLVMDKVPALLAGGDFPASGRVGPGFGAQ